MEPSSVRKFSTFSQHFPNKIQHVKLIKLSEWVAKKNIAYYVLSAGMIVMLLWAGAYKMTMPGADGIVPLVSNSPLISWHFKVFGTYPGSSLIGLVEITCAIFLLTGFFRPKAGLIGGAIGAVIFFVTSTFFLSTPGTLTHVHGFSYMSDLGLFLFKDIISLGANLYFISYYSKKIQP